MSKGLGCVDYIRHQLHDEFTLTEIHAYTHHVTKLADFSFLWGKYVDVTDVGRYFAQELAAANSLLAEGPPMLSYLPPQIYCLADRTAEEINEALAQLATQRFGLHFEERCTAESFLTKRVARLDPEHIVAGRMTDAFV